MIVGLDLPPGDAGTRRTLAVMAGIVQAAESSPVVRLVGMMLRQGEGRHPAEVRRRVWSWGRLAVKFRADPASRELLRSPAEMIAEIGRDGVTYGDCDELAVLLASVMAAAGLRVGFAVMAAKGSERWQHVAAAAWDEHRRGWVVVDPQESDKPDTVPAASDRLDIYEVPVD